MLGATGSDPGLALRCSLTRTNGVSLPQTTLSAQLLSIPLPEKTPAGASGPLFLRCCSYSTQDRSNLGYKQPEDSGGEKDPSLASLNPAWTHRVPRRFFKLTPIPGRHVLLEKGARPPVCRRQCQVGLFQIMSGQDEDKKVRKESKRAERSPEGKREEDRQRKRGGGKQRGLRRGGGETGEEGKKRGSSWPQPPHCALLSRPAPA